MPNHFLCKCCGIITDEPEIVPHPEKDAHFRELEAKIDEFIESTNLPNYFYTLQEEAELRRMGSLVHHKYNHSITCPTCLKETRFWREAPFPADKPYTEEERIAATKAFYRLLPKHERTVGMEPDK